ncbi:MAG: Dabb family protein [Pseudomonadota bacterium]
MIRHLVALRYKPGTSDAAKAMLMDELEGLRDHIDGIIDFQVRANVSVEDEMVRGFRDLFWFDFRDTLVRDVYLTDTVHQQIGARLVDALEGGPEGIFVLDFQL